MTGRYEGANDAWSFTTARNAIIFQTQSALNSAATQRFAIQNFAGQLGILSNSGGNSPITVWNDNGNVGIGTVTPTGRLTVSSTTANYENSLVVNTAWPSITLSGTNTTNRTWSVLNGGPGAGIGVGNFGIFDVTAGAYRFNIDSAGRIGIGNQSPIYNLDVAGNMRVSNGNDSMTLYGPNASWGSTLKVGAGPDTGACQVISTDGSFHLDAATGKNIYNGYHRNPPYIYNYASAGITNYTRYQTQYTNVDGDANYQMSNESAGANAYFNLIIR
jgi:hypothetical protein